MTKLLMVLMVLVLVRLPLSGATGDTRIAKWKNDCTGALVFGFDDSQTVHADFVVPAFASRDLTGTFYVNPGRGDYISRKAVWEFYVPRHGQHLANHTMNHKSVANYAEAEYEIGEAARIIWAAYPESYSKLIAYCGPGGTTWNITTAEKTELINKYHCIDRGKSPQRRSIVYDNGYDLAKMKTEAQWAITNNSWMTFYTHGVTETGIGNLSMRQSDLLAFLDWLITMRGTLWNGGFIHVYQYQEERNNSTVSTLSAGSGGISLRLTTTLDTLYYEVPLTLVTEVPISWDLCRVTSGSVTAYARAAGGSLMFDIRPNLGDITITPVTIPAISSITGPGNVYEGQQAVFSVTTVSDGACTWQWKKDGTDITGATDSTYAIADAAAADAGTYTCVASEGGNSHTSGGAVLQVLAPQVQTGLVWEAENAYVTAPMENKGTYLYHNPPYPATDPADGGKASWFFQLTQAGTYTVELLVLAYREGYRTVFIDIDKEPADATMAWDIEITSGFEWRTASWRGTGTVSANQIVPKTWSLDVGTHELVVTGGDQKIRIDSVRVVPAGSPVHDDRARAAVYPADGQNGLRYDLQGRRMNREDLPAGIYLEYSPGTRMLRKQVLVR